jgi:hypothetical protein
MKPFTSKHCMQYLTKNSPLNQGLILKNDNRPIEVINAETKKAIEKREKLMGKPKPTVIDKVKKSFVDKKTPQSGFKPGSQADEATLKRMSSTKYKK